MSLMPKYLSGGLGIQSSGDLFLLGPVEWNYYEINYKLTQKHRHIVI